MSILSIVVLVFVLIESLNVLTLYFAPGSQKANGVGVFNAWEKSKEYPEIHDFIRYLVYWVAGTKLIFLSLLVVLALVADQRTLSLALVALILSILSFFWKLYPLICKMDRDAQITPKNYSKALGVMVGSFALIFLGILVAHRFSLFG